MPSHIVEMLASLGITDRDAHFEKMAHHSLLLREHGIRVVSGLDAGAMPGDVEVDVAVLGRPTAVWVGGVAVAV